MALRVYRMNTPLLPEVLKIHGYSNCSVRRKYYSRSPFSIDQGCPMFTTTGCPCRTYKVLEKLEAERNADAVLLRFFDNGSHVMQKAALFCIDPF